MNPRRYLSASVSSIVFGALLASAPIACSGADASPSEGRDDDYRVKPAGSDLPGYVIVKAPDGAANVEPTTVRIGGMSVKLGERLGPIAVGEQSFGMKTEGGGGWFDDGFRANVLSNQTTVVTTALVGVNATGGPPTLGLGTYRDRMWTGIPITPKSGNTGQVDAQSDGTKLLPLIGGDYEINFGVNAIDGVPATVRSGETKTVTLTDMSARRVTRLRAPVRELPTAPCGQSGNEWWIGRAGDPVVGNYPRVTLKDGEELDLGVSPRHEGEQYALYVPYWRNRATVPLAERGAGPRTWAVGRIDVDHVSVNSNPPTVEGTYEVYLAAPNGARQGSNILSCSPKTNTGVDVPPGKYRVEVTYLTKEAGNKVDVHVIDVK